jgi:diguanylate cyclase (GGDEF)-like protein
MGETPPARGRWVLLRGALPIWGFTAALAVATTLIWVIALRIRGIPAVPIHLPWAVLVVGFAAGHFAGIRIEARGQAHNIDLSDIVLLPAIVFASPGSVVLAAALGTLFRSVWVRRPVIKSAFNIALHAFAAAVAYECWVAVLAGSPVRSAKGALAGLTAVIVAEVVTNAGIQAVIAISSRRLRITGWSNLRLSIFVQVALVTGFGLFAVHMLWSGWAGGVLLAAVAIAVGSGYLSYGRLRSRHAHLERLHRFERSLTGLGDTESVAETVLRGGQELFNAEVTQLLRREAGGWLRYSFRSGAAALDVSHGPHALAELADHRSGAVLAPKGTSDPEAAEALRESPFRDAVVAPLPSEAAGGWMLVLADRRGASHLSFGPDDLELAEALAMPAAMALRSSDLLDQLHAEVALKHHQASHDGLTGLANRMLFSSEMNRSLSERASTAIVGILNIDLDGFKRINDRLGHEAGDGALKIVGDRLVAAVGDSGTVGRLGGDEFAVVLPHLSSPDEIIEIARRVDTDIRVPALVGGATIQLRASIGVAIAPFHGEDQFSLLRQADMAMYQAKQTGGGVFVQSDRHTDRIDRPSLIGALRHAIETSGLTVEYQPTVAFASGEVSGVEALARWTHPLYGVIAPDEFIPVAEASGLIEPLTRWMLETAFSQVAKWRSAGFDLSLAVNISPEHVTYLNLIRHIETMLSRYQLPAGMLTLEITESGAPGKYRVESTELLTPLAALGVSVSLDDFGVGTSSLARLKSLPVDQLKIDKSFTERLTTDPTDYAIVASTINMAHDLGLRVTAEGVETADAYRVLHDLECDLAQGYLISRPLAPADMTRWLYDLKRSDPARPVSEHAPDRAPAGATRSARWEVPHADAPLDPRMSRPRSPGEPSH